MAQKQATSNGTAKRANGEGETMTIYFDLHDKTERRAMQMSKMLAAKHGRRKQFIVAVLASLYDVFEATGELPEAHHVAALLSNVTPASSIMTTATSSGYSANNKPAVRKRAGSKAPRVAVTSVPAKTSAADVGRAFTASAGAAFFD